MFNALIYTYLAAVLGEARAAHFVGKTDGNGRRKRNMG